MALTLITKKSAIRAAVGRVRREFRRRGTRCKRAIGYRGGQDPSAEINVVHEAQLWFAYSPLENRHWCVYGTLPLPDKRNLPITVQINPPLAGKNPRIGGLLAADGSGTIHLCHNGAIGGGVKGVGQGAFLAWFDSARVPVVDPDGKATLAFPIAEIGSQRMIEQIAEFVWAVADFKAGLPSRLKSAAKGAFAGSAEEYEGSCSVAPRDGYIASADHSIIRNRLADLIAATGRKVSRDQQRDILVGSTAKPEAEFEIKTSAEPQCVYTAVGQLLLHDTMLPVKKRVVVLPASVAPRTRRAIALLRIDLVTFSWGDTHIRFVDLDRIIPGISDTAPIKRST